MGSFNDLTNRRFGMLLVLGVSPKTKITGRYYWICLCDCGNKVEYRSEVIINKNCIKNCGCLKIKKLIQIGQSNRKHGLINTPEYIAWSKMRIRCNNSTNKDYKNYGGRGISVCKKWDNRENGFSNFISDMGFKPDSSYSLDRIDVNGNYEPSNCRWATKKVQNNNKRNNHLVTYHNKTQSLAMWAEEYGIDKNKLIDRVKKGWDFKRAITT